MPQQPHEVGIHVSKPSGGKWEIRITGVTSGAVIHFGDGDTGALVFHLDASRFYPLLK